MSILPRSFLVANKFILISLSGFKLYKTKINMNTSRFSNKKRSKFISVLIVNFNLSQSVLELVTRMLQSCDQDVEVLVFDNASSDYNRKYLASFKHERFYYFYSDINLGYGAANNKLSIMAKGHTLFLLNPDAEIYDPKTILNFYKENYMGRRIILAPKIIYPNGEVQQNFFFRHSTSETLIPNLFSAGKIYRSIERVFFLGPLIRRMGKLVFGHSANEYLERHLSINEVEKCAWVSGAALFISKDLFLTLDGFDEGFFLYSEDEDLCRRAASIGIEIIMDSRIQLIHVGGGSQPEISFFSFSVAKAHRIKSAIRYLNKYNGDFDTAVYKLAVILRVLIQPWLLYNRKTVALLLRAIFSK